jgi:ABC-type glycerol-3-phosphate transport system substrate-binding protein
MPDGAGNQDSVIGVVTGYVVNAKSTKQDAAAEFLALLNSPENVQEFIAAELTPMAKSASEGQDIDSRSARLNELLTTAPAIVLPPDTGYDLEMANALYSALAEVLGGQKSPSDALAGIDQKLG